MKKNLRNLLLAVSAGLVIAKGGNALYSSIHPERSPVYKYAINKNVKPIVAEELEKKLNYELENNYAEFIDALSIQDQETQKIFVDSDLLDNKKISNKELENAKKRKLDKKGLQIENPQEIYAVLANSSNLVNVEKYSRENSINSMINLLSFYKFIKEEGAEDENISLFLYNPAQINLTETEVYKSLLEKKLFEDILPTEKDIQEKMKSFSKRDFINSIKTLNADSNDLIFIAWTIPSLEKTKEKIELTHGANNHELEINKEIVLPFEIGSSINNLNYEKAIILQSSFEQSKILHYINRTSTTQSVLLTDSEKVKLGLTNTIAISLWNEKENAMMHFIKKYKQNKNQSIKNLASSEGYNSKVFYFNSKEKSPEECPWFYKPLIKDKN